MVKLQLVYPFYVSMSLSLTCTYVGTYVARTFKILFSLSQTSCVGVMRPHTFVTFLEYLTHLWERNPHHEFNYEFKFSNLVLVCGPLVLCTFGMQT